MPACGTRSATTPLPSSAAPALAASSRLIFFCALPSRSAAISTSSLAIASLLMCPSFSRLWLVAFAVAISLALVISSFSLSIFSSERRFSALCSASCLPRSFNSHFQALIASSVMSPVPFGPFQLMGVSNDDFSQAASIRSSSSGGTSAFSL